MAQCRLCGRTAELQESHIIPKFVIRQLKNSSGGGMLRSGKDPNLRNCLKSNGCRTRIGIKCGCEDTKLSNGLERQPVEYYPAIDSSGQIGTTTRTGHAD